MTETKKELAFTLFDQGLRPSSAEVKALKLKPKSTYAYFQLWKKAHPELGGSATLESKDTTTVKGGIPTAPLVVGKITITPENWGMTQYGAILILDTYNKSKRDLDYGGTIGDFICDICEFYRRILNYTEVEYVRATSEASEGGRGTEKDGVESLEPAVKLTEKQ